MLSYILSPRNIGEEGGEALHEYAGRVACMCEGGGGCAGRRRRRGGRVEVRALACSYVCECV